MNLSKPYALFNLGKAGKTNLAVFNSIPGSRLNTQYSTPHKKAYYLHKIKINGNLPVKNDKINFHHNNKNPCKIVTKA